MKIKQTIAVSLALSLIAGSLVPAEGLELPRRFVAVDEALATQFAQQAAPLVQVAPVGSVAPAKARRSRTRLYLSAVLTAGAGLVAYWSKERADKAYDRYLHSANTSRQDREYDRAERLDRIAGASYIGMEVGLVLSSYLLFFGR
jgi:hypothetical protein